MQNIFQEGDLIFYDLKGPNKDFLPSKLTTPYKDPYVVLSQYKNDITCRHANVGTVQVFTSIVSNSLEGSYHSFPGRLPAIRGTQHHSLPRRSREAQRNGIPAGV